MHDKHKDSYSFKLKMTPETKEDIKNLNDLLELFDGSATLIGDILTIHCDYSKAKKRATRNAGKPRAKLQDPIYISELEQMISETSAIETAKKLGISHSTMYRKIKKAKEKGLDWIM